MINFAKWLHEQEMSEANISEINWKSIGTGLALATAAGGAMFGGGLQGNKQKPNIVVQANQDDLTTDKLHDMAEKGTKGWNSDFGDNVGFILPDGSVVHYSEDGNFYKTVKNVVQGKGYQKWTGNSWGKISLHTDYKMQKHK